MADPIVMAPRNGHASIQLVLRPVRRMEKISVSVEGLGAGNQRKVDFQTRLVGNVVVAANTKQTPREELIHSAPALFPDVLYEDLQSSLEAGRTQSLWLTLTIPDDAPPGSHRAEVVVREDGIERIRAPFRFVISAATVPSRQTLKVTNWFYLTDRQLRSHFNVRTLSEDWWTLIENMGRVLADHRQNMIVTPLTGFYFSKLSLIQAKLGPSGLEYDFSNFDRWVRTFQKAGVIGYIEGSHVLRREDDGEDPTGPLKVDVFVIEDGKAILKSLKPDDPRTPQALASMLTALHRHLEQNGWLKIYYQHVLDEVREDEMPTYREYAGIVHRAMPGVKTIDAVSADRDLEVYEKSCDVWVPVLGSFDHLVDRLQKHARAGGEVWFYTCLVPVGRYPNRFIDFSLVKVRQLQWLNFRYGLTGFLHWGGNYWPSDPWNETEPPIGGGSRTLMLPSGDAFITYPNPAKQSILSSIRLEMMREAIEDYELLKSLEHKDPAAAAQLGSRMIRSFTDYVREPKEFRQIQRALLQALDSPR
ncbi:MAG: glycoside hydrolase domain-containing protein [Terriglobia bacterium]